MLPASDSTMLLDQVNVNSVNCNKKIHRGSAVRQSRKLSAVSFRMSAVSFVFDDIGGELFVIGGWDQSKASDVARSRADTESITHASLPVTETARPILTIVLTAARSTINQLDQAA